MNNQNDNARRILRAFILRHGAETGVNGALCVLINKHEDILTQIITDCEFEFSEVTTALFHKAVTDTEDDMVLYHLLCEAEDFYNLFVDSATKQAA